MATSVYTVYAEGQHNESRIRTIEILLLLGYPLLEMTPYRPATYQAPRLATAYRRPIMAQTFDQLLGFPVCTGDICRLVFHTGATVLGIHVGLKEKGLIAIVGWV